MEETEYKRDRKLDNRREPASGHMIFLEYEPGWSDVHRVELTIKARTGWCLDYENNSCAADSSFDSFGKLIPYMRRTKPGCSRFAGWRITCYPHKEAEARRLLAEVMRKHVSSLLLEANQTNTAITKLI